MYLYFQSQKLNVFRIPEKSLSAYVVSEFFGVISLFFVHSYLIPLLLTQVLHTAIDPQVSRRKTSVKLSKQGRTNMFFIYVCVICRDMTMLFGSELLQID